MSKPDFVNDFIEKRKKESPNAEVIYILGGGAAGLFTAYQLLHDQPEKDFIVVVFDGMFRSTSIGGNGYTLPVMVGNQQRWVDLGVNDLNKTAYKNTFKVMDDLNKNGINVEMKKLEDSTIWAGTHKGKYWEYSYEDLINERDNAPKIKEEYERFSKNAYKDWIGFYKENFKITVGEYCDKHGYSETFRLLNLYPRINGMYYVDWSKPVKDMPLGAVMMYYHYQEGFGADGDTTPDRRYFVKGSSHWLKGLAQRIEQLGGLVCTDTLVIDIEKSDDKGITITTNETEYSEDSHIGYYDCDKLVFACHANVAAGFLKKETGTKNIVNQLNQINYNLNLDIVVAHQNKKWLPEWHFNRGAFNVTIHESYDKPNPYVMTYCVNYHQNDKASGKHSELFYVTVNPNIAKDGSDDDKILKTPGGDLAIAHFSHNTESEKSRAAQYYFCANKEHELYGGKVYFSGGWLVGAGLHEECYESARRTVAAICGTSNVNVDVPKGMKNDDAYLLQAMSPQDKKDLGCKG